jgi:polyisoprenyl-phosphate glycosyltransferase
MTNAAAERIVILMPVYDDWASAAVLIARLQTALRGATMPVEYLLVDDGSSEEPPSMMIIPGDSATSVQILRLRRNLGHQRAIAIGLTWVHVHFPCRGVLVMDADGEDTPEGAAKLLERFEREQEKKTIFAARARRTEGIVFRAFYVLYRILSWLLTGRNVRVGNFSVIPREHLARLVGVSELWSHYAASVFKARLPNESVPLDRGHRIAGVSKMNLLSLITHGLSASAVFSEVMALRLLVATFLLAIAALVGVAVVVALRFLTNLAVPGLATLATGILMVIFFQAFSIAMVFVFLTLQGRSAMGFLPIRDYAFFVDRVDRVQIDG